MHSWFETVAIAQERARRALPGTVYNALIAGAERGVTLKDNVAAFDELGFAPIVVGQPATRELSTTVLGQPISMPVLISPAGVQGVHPEGEVAIARAAAARGIAQGLSSFGSRTIEDVVAANPQVFFQMYWSGTRDVILSRVERARQAGAVGLIVTTDWSFSNGRDWGSPKIPEKLDLKTMAKMSPQGIRKPRWLLEYAKTMAPPTLTTPNLAPKNGTAPGFFDAYYEWMQTPPPTWEDIAWLRQQWDAPLLLKGVCRVDDALRAVDAGVTGISVSNHGGNNLDGTPAAIRCLPAVADAVNGQIEVLLDGGVRRGSDVVKALGLGAKAVMIGRAALWGLGAGGQAGVENVLDVIRGGIDATLRGIGVSNVNQITREDVFVPDGFIRTLGTSRQQVPTPNPDPA